MLFVRGDGVVLVGHIFTYARNSRDCESKLTAFANRLPRLHDNLTRPDNFLLSTPQIISVSSSVVPVNETQTLGFRERLLLRQLGKDA